MVEGDEEVSVVPGTSAGNNMDFATPEKQEARAFLRERFLRVITGIIGEKFSFDHRAYTSLFLSDSTSSNRFAPLSLTHR